MQWGKLRPLDREQRLSVRLNRERDFQLADAQPDSYLLKSAPVLFDEWQRLPLVWEAVKDSVDAD